MPFDSNGVFTRKMNWTSDQQNGIAIECGRHDQEDDNFAQGFNDTFCRDGRAAATGDFNLGQHKVKNLANAVASTDAVNKGQMDTALGGKQATITGAASTITATNLTASRALVSDGNGKVAVSSTTSTEVGYLSGVTSAIQTQLDGKIAATISKAANGYCKLDNGLIIQWGTLSSGKTITYSTAFTNTNSYALVFNNSAGTDGYGRADQVASKTSTSATVNGLCENPIRWLAIGY